MSNPSGATLRATVADILAPHPDIHIIRVRVDGQQPVWLAGQFMEISFAGFPARPYSIASAPHENFIEFHIRNNNRGGTSQHAVTGLKTGDALILRGPFGKATMQGAVLQPIVMMAGGMGISPCKAIIDDILRTIPAQPVTLYWGVKTAAELYLSHHFADQEKIHPQFRFIPVIEERGEGLVNDATLHHEKDFVHKTIYLSGPPAMIAASLQTVLHHGGSTAHIRGDDPQIKGITP